MTRMEQAAVSGPVLAVPDYWDQAKRELMKRDRIMHRLIPQFGDLHLSGRGEPFSTLVRAIIGQQISTRAADSVWQRFLLACPKCTPPQVLKSGVENLAACGLSRRKAEYILDLADHFKHKRVHAQQDRPADAVLGRGVAERLRDDGGR